jgi:hypothetical protein
MDRGDSKVGTGYSRGVLVKSAHLWRQVLDTGPSRETTNLASQSLRDDRIERDLIPILCDCQLVPVPQVRRVEGVAQEYVE